MSLFLIALLGAFSCRYRGGIFGKKKDKLFDLIKPVWLRKVLWRLFDGKVVNSVIWALFCSYLFASSLQDHVYVLLAPAAILFVYQFIVMLRFSAPGWGDYIGAAVGNRTDTPAEPLQEVEYIDELIKGLKNKPVLWGIAGLSLRCGEWGLFLGAPLITYIGFGAFYPMFVGLLAGPVIYLLGKVNKQHAWENFEALLGAGLFVSVAIAAGV